jgi:hypothetical protein
LHTAIMFQYFGPGRWMVRFGILLNASVVSTWAVTRFVGVPMLFGFTRLSVELPNLAATAAEIGLLVLLFRIGRELKRERRSQRVR